MVNPGRKIRLSDRGHKREQEISDLHTGGFSADGSRGLRFLERICPGHNLTRESLVALGRVFSLISGVKFPRDFTRRRILVIKWFDDNIDGLEPVGSILQLDATFVNASHAYPWFSDDGNGISSPALEDCM
jgi:hypothetical protein